MKQPRRFLFTCKALRTYRLTHRKIHHSSYLYLNGRIDSWYKEELSVQISKGVKGVREVIPNFKVSMKARRSDSEIASEIKRRMK